MDREFFGNPLNEYLWVAGIILAVLLLNRIISKYIALLFAALFRRGWKMFDRQKFLDLIIHPLGSFIVISVSIAALYRLRIPQELDVNIYRYPLSRVLLALGTMVQLLVFTWLLLRVIDFIASILEQKASLTPEETDNQLVVFFRDFLKVIISIIGIVMVLRFAFGYNVNSLLTGLSIVGAAIALALRESLENLIASFVIFFDKPFTTGDTVKVNQVTGRVERIGLRSTRIRSDQKTYVTVPNKQMVDSVLDNHSLRTQHRNELLLQVSLDTHSVKIETLMKDIRAFLSGIPEIESYNVVFQDINLQAYVILVEFFVPAAYMARFRELKQQLNLFALKKIEELQISIAGNRKVPV